MANPSFREDTRVSLPGIEQGSVAWADYSGDGRPDFLLTGYNGSTRISKLYLNTGSGFREDTRVSLPGVSNSSVAWADYNGDGKPDFLLTGYNSGQLSKLYLNTGSGFREDTRVSLPGVFQGSVAWQDYNGDGRSDLLLTGNSGRFPNYTRISKLYLNTGSGLTEDVSVQLPGVGDNSVAWQDYNGDGRPDFLLTGSAGSNISKLYLNTGSGFREDTRVSLPGVSIGSVAWQDYNGDSRPDFLLTGEDSSYRSISKLYLNTGSGFREDTRVSLPGVRFSSVAWSDYNGDNKPDFLLTGELRANPFVDTSKLYLNTGSGFTEDTTVQLPDVSQSSVAWQDYNGDGRPDFLLTGSAGSNISKLYLNYQGIPPVANNDTATTSTNTTVFVNILQNDSDPDGNITGVDLNPSTPGIDSTVTIPGVGQWVQIVTNRLSFIPANNFAGTATLPYRVFDNDGLTSNIATVNIGVTNQPPVVNSEGVTLNTFTTPSVTINIGANDSDPDGSITAYDLQPFTPGLQSSYTNFNAAYKVDSQGQLIITPVDPKVFDPTLLGIGSGQYRAIDNLGVESPVADFVALVKNQPPIANDDIRTTDFSPSGPISINVDVIANDSDAEIAPIGGIDLVRGIDLDMATPGIQNQRTTAQGSFYAYGRTISFQPNDPYFKGTATLPYGIYDIAGASATANFIVISQNQPPVANNDTLTTARNTGITLNIGVNDSDVDGSITGFDLDPSTAAIEVTKVTSEGTYSVNNNNGRLIFTPANNFIGTATLPYKAIDNNGGTSNIATVNINVTNQPPVVTDDRVTLNTFTTPSVTINIGANDSDPDGSITGYDLDPNTPGVQSNFTDSNAEYRVDSQGQLVITPVKPIVFNPTLLGIASGSYRAIDNLGIQSPVAGFEVFINNQPPIANDDIRTTTFSPGTRQSILVNVASNDSDAEIAPVGGIDFQFGLDLDIATPGRQNELTTAQGYFYSLFSDSISFRPNDPNFKGTATLPYVIQDKAGATATANLIIIGQNEPPIATDDTRTTTGNTGITFNIGANDSDPGGSITGFDLNPSTAVIDVTRITSEGTYSVNNSGSLSFTPANNFKGTAVLPYQAIDNDGATSNVATVSIGVTNQAPVANPDSSIVLSNTVFTLNIGTNDSDPDGSITGFDLNPSQAGVQTTRTIGGFGSYSVNNQGELVFTPAANVNNLAGYLDYQAIDNNGLTSNIGIVKIGLADNRPIALDDETTINSQTNATTLAIGVNDTDLDGSITAFDLNPTTATVQSNITRPEGTYSVNNSGQLVFTAVAGFAGTATLPYQVWDNSGVSSNPAIITIVRTGALTAGNDSTSTLSNTTVTLNLASNDSSPNGSITAFDLDPTTATIETDITNNTGHYILDNSGKLTFIPAQNYQGVASIPYSIVDSVGETATANINISVQGQAPVATDDVRTITSNEKVTFNIGINDSDPDGSITGFDLNPGTTGTQTSATTAAGTFSMDNNGQVVFTPASNFQGTAVLPYQAIDNSGTTSNIATISVAVGNQLPIANDDSTNTIGNRAVTLNIGANDSDPDGIITGFDLDINTAGVQTNLTDTTGIYSVNNNGELVFTPDSNFRGTANISYQAIDNSETRATADVSINVANQLPIANNDSTNTLSNQAVTLNIGANDSDPDGNITGFDLDPTTTTVENTIRNSAGLWQVDNSGKLVFTPDQNYQGVATLAYGVVDNSGDTATANISITLGNQPPVATNDIRNTTSNQTGTFNIGINDSDPDGSITAFDLNPTQAGIQRNISRAEGRYSVDNNGQLVFTPANNFQGTASIPYVVVDNSGATDTATFTIIVSNQLPIANDDSTNTLTKQPVTLNIGANDSDPDGSITGFDLDTKRGGVQSSIKTTQGSYSINNQGELVFRPLANTQGLTVLEYQAIDNSGARGYANIIVDVKNTPPIANNDSTNTASNQAVTLNIGANDSDPDGNITGFDLDTKKKGVQTNHVTANGTYSVDTNGELVFTPVSNYKGTANLNYQVLDNEGATDNARVTVVVGNQPPVAWNDKGNVQENSKITLNILANDFDLDGSITGIDLNPKDKVIQTERVTAEGTYSVDKAGNLVFTPVNGFVGTANLPYEIIDNNGARARAEVSIEVRDIPPIAVDDLTTTNQNQAVSLNILANDIDPDGGSITGIDLNPSQAGVQNAVTRVHGVYEVNRQGNLVFTPARGFVGTAEIPYTIFDNNGEAATARIQILVGNQPPIANPDITQTKQGQAVTLNILNNDIDPDGSITGIDLEPKKKGIQRQLTTSAGSFSVNNNGELTFRPANGFVGTANIPYQIIDNNGATAGTDVTILVGDVPPVAVDDLVLTDRNQAVTFNVLSNDFDLDGSITAVDLNPGQAGIQRQRVTNQGTYSVDGQGNVVFNPVRGFAGTATLPYEIIDNNGEKAQANINVLVGDVPPIANDDSTFTNQNQPVTLNILTNDLDVDGSITAVDLNPGQAGIQRQRVTAEGTYSVDTAGNLVFTPKAGFTGKSSIEYQVIDNDGQTANASAKVTIEVGDIAPIATDDTANTLRNQAVTLNVLSNDSDPDGNITAVDLNPGQAGIQRQITTAEGTFSVDAVGNVVFRPAQGFEGIASIPYAILDNSGVSATANIIIGVGDVPPIANDDSTFTNQNQPITLNILTNDLDVDGSITAVDLNPSQAGIQRQRITPEGTYSVDTAGNLVFTPASGFVGTSSLEYQVIDNDGQTANASAKVTIEVGDIAPIATDDTANTLRNQAVSLNVLNNDSDPDGNITAVDLNPNQTGIQRQITTGEGTFSVDNNGNVTFTPVRGFEGIASIPYAILDNSGVSATANIIIGVGDVPPIANDDSTFTNQNQPVTLNILTNDLDVDGSITAVDLNPGQAGIQRQITTKQGIFSVDGNGELTFRPAKGFTGVAALPYAIVDNDGATATANISISVGKTVSNILPVAVDDGTNTTVNQPVTMNILNNDFDVDGSITAVDLDPTRAGIQRNVTTAQGTFSVDNNGELVFTPASGFVGTATLQYQITDNSGATDIGNITIGIPDPVAGDQPPVANNDATYTFVDQPVNLNILSNDFDTDGSITAVDLNPNQNGIQERVTTAQGIFSVTQDGELTFTPAKGFVGDATLEYQITDDLGATSTANITIAVIEPATNQPPVANNDSANTQQNTAVNLNILANDSDTDGSITAVDLNPNQAGIQRQISNKQGVFSVDQDGNLTFRPAKGFTGVASLPYVIIDNEGATATANINIGVGATVSNILPVAVDDGTNTTANQPVTMNILSNDFDVDGSITAVDLDPTRAGIQRNVTTAQGTFSVDNNGELVFTPASGFVGTATLQYQITDNSGATDIGNITIGIPDPVAGDQPPVANNDATYTFVDQPVNLNILSNDFDTDGSITAVDLNPNQNGIQERVTTAQGIFSVTQDGELTFTPAKGFVGDATLEYQITDDLGATSTANITIAVIEPATNQPPVANNDSANTQQNTAVNLNILSNDSDADGSITAVDLNPNQTGIQQRISNKQGVFSVDANGELTFTPAKGFTGIATLPYAIIDNEGASATANISIAVEATVSNILPVAVDDGTNTTVNQPVTINILSNDFDVDGSITAVDLNPTQAGIQRNVTTAQGTFSVDNNGELVFTPASDFVGTATLQYQITDNSGATDIGNITIGIPDPVAGDQPPVANNDATYTFVDQPVNLNILSNDFDTDGSITAVDLDPTRAGIQEQVTTAQGTFSVSQDGELTFTPASGFVGDATLEYQITDDLGATSTANITIAVIEEPTVINQPPVATDDSANTQENTAVNLNILANDSDADGSITGIDLDPTTANIETAVTTSQGIFQVSGDGNLTFTPANGFTGVATLPYQIFDNQGASDTANIRITVEQTTIIEPPIITEPDNQRPVAVYDTTSTTQNQPVTLNILTNDSDPDGQITAVDLNPDVDGIQRQVTTAQGSFSLDNNGILTFVPVSTFTGVATLTYQVTDNDGAQDTAIINIRVNQASKPLEPIECDCEEPVLIDNTPQPVDVLNTVTGADIIGSAENDNVFGTEASENILTDGGDDAIDGQGGNDNIIAGRGNDFILGEDGNDYILGERDTDVIFAGKDNDFVRGGKDDDLIGGEFGNDTLLGDKGNDAIIGGRVDEEDAIGEDWLYGGVGNDELDGQGGNDYLNGEADNDSLFGGDGNDLLNGGENNDLLYGERGDDKLIGGNGEDTIYAGKDNDIITGNEGDDLIFGGEGKDTLGGGAGNDTLHGRNGNFSDTPLEGEEDYLSGGEGNDWILGEEAADKLCGDAGDDTLQGGRGNDTLCGGDGDDWLLGELGDDTIISGAGNDQIFLNNEGKDLIADLEIGVDQLVLPQGVSFNQLTFTQSNTGTLINYDGKEIALLSNIASTDITADLFKTL